MSSGGSNGPCPECEIIILSYAKIPSKCEDVKWRALAIEDLYGTDFIKAKIADNPSLHAANLQKLHNVLDNLKAQEQVLSDIIQALAP